MALKIVWTVPAKIDNDSIIEYLDKEWTEKEKQKYLRKLDSKLKSISIFPNLGARMLSENNIRGIIVTKHSRLYYKKKDNQIIILRLFDTRSNPDKFVLNN